MYEWIKILPLKANLQTMTELYVIIPYDIGFFRVKVGEDKCICKDINIA